MEWPGSLPTAPLYGWTEVPGTSTIRTDTDAGPAKMRQRFSSAPSQFSMQFALDTSEATLLMDFFTNSTAGGGTAGGSITFGTLPHPRTNVAPTSTATTGWRFLSPPIITQNSFGRFNASVSLELLG